MPSIGAHRKYGAPNVVAPPWVDRVLPAMGAIARAALTAVAVGAHPGFGEDIAQCVVGEVGELGDLVLAVAEVGDGFGQPIEVIIPEILIEPFEGVRLPLGHPRLGPAGRGASGTERELLMLTMREGISYWAASYPGFIAARGKWPPTPQQRGYG